LAWRTEVHLAPSYFADAADYTSVAGGGAVAVGADAVGVDVVDAAAASAAGAVANADDTVACTAARENFAAASSPCTAAGSDSEALPPPLPLA